MAAFEDFKTIKNLNSMCGEMFAMLCVADIHALEKRVINAIVIMKNKGTTDELLSSANKTAALLGCLSRLYDDLYANTQVAKDCKKEYDLMKERGELPNT